MLYTEVYEKSNTFLSRFFRDVTLPASEKPQIKIPSKLKEALREAKLAVEKRLKEEKKVVSYIQNI